MTLRWGVLGLGTIARAVHLPLIARMPGHELVAVADLDPVLPEDAREPVACVLQLAPRHLPLVAAEVLPQHRELVGRVLVADVLGDVVAVGDDPLVRGDRLVVARKAAV